MQVSMPAAVSGAPVQKGFSAMNFRISAASVGLLGRVFALMAATALTGALLASDAQAQTAAPAPAAAAPAAPAAPKAKAKAKAAPKAAPAAQEQPAPAPAPAPAAQAAPPAAGAPGAVAAQGQEPPIDLIYSPWTKFCMKGQDAAAKQICFIGKDGRIESGQVVIAAAIIQPEGEKPVLRLTLPLGMKLVHGTRMYVDANPPAQNPFVACFANGCLADYEMPPELIANMKKGQNLVVQAINTQGVPLTLPLPLQEAGGGSFGKAYDGPPTDPKQFEETQRKLQEELQKRAEEARKKLEAASQPAGGAPANPAAK
jgi:invasion protein IalB